MGIPSVKNRVGMSVTGTPGTGTITLNAAESSYQSFATAYGANANVDVLIVDGTAWEVARDCTYTHSGTTLSRGTLEASSTGSAISLTGSAKVYVTASAERLRKGQQGYLEHSSHNGTAAVTGVVGTLHVFTGLTADRDFTLPATAAVGDRIGVTFPAGSASYEILLKSASGDKINNVDCSSTEWSRLFIAGETVIFRCIDGSTVDWVVEYDGRIPCTGLMYLASDADGESAATVTLPTSASNPASWTTINSNGVTVDTATGKFTVRRNGIYHAHCAGRAKDTLVSGKYYQILIYKNGSELDGATIVTNGTNLIKVNASIPAVSLNAGDYLQLYYMSQDGNVGLRGSGTSISFIGIAEVI